MLFALNGTVKEATANVEDVVHIVAESDGVDDFRVHVGGDASVATHCPTTYTRKNPVSGETGTLIIPRRAGT